MKTRYPYLLLFLILIGLPSLAFPIEDRTKTQAAQDGQSLRKTEELVGRLGPRTLRNKEDARPVAEEGLRIVFRLLAGAGERITEENVKHAQELGFEPDDTINRAEPLLADAFPIFEVNLNDLRDFAPGKEVKNLLLYTHQLLIPIRVDNTVRSSLTIRFVPDAQGEVEQKGKGASWRLTRWGLPILIRQLTDAQRKLTTQKPGFLLSFQALNRNFFGYEENAVIRLVPLAKDHHFTVGEPYLAQDVFKWLSEEAMSVDDSRPR